MEYLKNNNYDNLKSTLCESSLPDKCTFLEENNCSLESISEDINTSTANGKFFIRMLTILA